MKKIYVGLGIAAAAGAVLIGVYGKNMFNQPGIENQGQDRSQDQNQGQNQDQNRDQANNQKNGTVNPSGSYSINELFAMNRPMKCTWKESAAGGDVTNIMYISGKNFYQDVTMRDLGHAYTVSNGEYLYIWNDFSGAASKMKITDAETGGNSKQEAAAALDQKKDFICENWSVDNSFFNPPQDKNFKDVTGEMQQATQEMKEGGLEDAKQRMCDLCQNAPTQEIKDQCLSNAQCNQ